MLIGRRANFKLTAGMSRLAVAATLLTLAGCGGSGDPEPNALAAVDSGLSTPAPVVPGWARFIYPTSGQLEVDGSHPFQWTVVPGSQAYQLQVGTSAGASDVDFEFERWESRALNVRLYEWGVRHASRIVVQNDGQARLCRERFGRDAHAYARDDQSR